MVETLTGVAPVVVFSAAIPGQGGVEHVNEQPPSYWSAKFAARRFSAHDVLRPLLWDDDNIAYYYRQNVILYLSEEVRVSFRDLPTAPPLEIVHPSVLRRPVPQPTLRMLVRELPRAVSRSVAWRTRRSGGKPESSSNAGEEPVQL